MTLSPTSSRVCVVDRFHFHFVIKACQACGFDKGLHATSAEAVCANVMMLLNVLKNFTANLSHFSGFWSYNNLGKGEGIVINKQSGVFHLLIYLHAYLFK